MRFFLKKLRPCQIAIPLYNFPVINYHGVINYGNNGFINYNVAEHLTKYHIVSGLLTHPISHGFLPISIPYNFPRNFPRWLLGYPTMAMESPWRLPFWLPSQGPETSSASNRRWRVKARTWNARSRPWSPMTARWGCRCRVAGHGLLGDHVDPHTVYTTCFEVVHINIYIYSHYHTTYLVCIYIYIYW